MSDDVTLVVDGKEYAGWKSVRIGAGIERVARDFDLSVTSQWPGSTVAQRVQPGMSCEVHIGSDKLVTGYVDATPISYEGKSVTVGIKGRSKTADLVDCCPLNMLPSGGWQEVDNGKGGPRALTQPADTQWKPDKLERIAAYLAKPYGVKVVAEVDTGNKVAFGIEQGETVFEIIDRMLRKNHVLASDTGNGDLVFIKAGSGGECTTPLVLGGNILSASAALDYKAVYTRYTCNGQRAPRDADGENEDASLVVSQSASETDNRIFKRVRALVLKQSGMADEVSCRDHVLYEKEHRLAKAVETTYVVAGWRQEDGSLWLPNKMVLVRDDVIGFDSKLLIAEVHWILDGQGKRAEMRVGPKSGYLTKTEKSQTKSWDEVKTK